VSVKVTTNNVPRDLISFDDLTPDERKDFDYIQDDYRGHVRFFRYKGEVYDTDDCEVSPSPQPWLANWSGYFSETFFSGVVFKYVPDTDWEVVVVGRYCT
jgi:hypothetical protein